MKTITVNERTVEVTNKEFKQLVDALAVNAFVHDDVEAAKSIFEKVLKLIASKK